MSLWENAWQTQSYLVRQTEGKKQKFSTDTVFCNAVLFLQVKIQDTLVKWWFDCRRPFWSSEDRETPTKEGVLLFSLLLLLKPFLWTLLKVYCCWKLFLQFRSLIEQVITHLNGIFPAVTPEDSHLCSDLGCVFSPCRGGSQASLLVMFTGEIF